MSSECPRDLHALVTGLSQLPADNPVLLERSEKFTLGFENVKEKIHSSCVKKMVTFLTS